MIDSDSIFSRQFCGQHSYGLEDLAQHVQQLPPCFAKDTHHTSLNKPQAQFMDKIDNSPSNQHAHRIFEQPFDLHSVGYQGCSTPSTFTSTPPTIIDDKIKFKTLTDQIESSKGETMVAALTCFSENLRSFYGFTCWIGLRVI